MLLKILIIKILILVMKIIFNSVNKKVLNVIDIIKIILVKL